MKRRTGREPTQISMDLRKEFTDFGLFCGLGGMAMGTARALVRYHGFNARFRCLGGIDNNEKACRNFTRLTGVQATCMDLFDEEQYEDWHGKPPPPDWRKAMPADILRAAGGEYPNIVELSPPCKGFSGLLSAEKSKSRKYQALNRLTVRGIFLTLEAFKQRLPAVIFLENVPRIQNRGADLLDTMRSMLESYGYAVHCGIHNAGKLYGGGQNRVRFFLIARHVAQVPRLIYKPRELPLRSIGSVLSELPWPGDVERGGAMHRLPQISHLTALRLACIRPGHDWRDLQKDLSNIRLEHNPREGAWLVSRWGEPSRTITGAPGIGISNSPTAVAHPLEDLAVNGDGKWTGQAMRVTSEDAPSPIVTSADGLSCGVASTVGVVRVNISNIKGITRRDGLGANFADSPGLMGVIPFDEPSPTVSGSAAVTSSNMPSAVQDIQIQSDPSRHTNHLGLTAWDSPGRTVTGATHVANGAPCVQDARLGHQPRGGGPYGVASWEEPGPTVIGNASVRGSTVAAVQDVRLPENDNRHTNKYLVQTSNEPARTVITSDRIGSGAPAVQDLRLSERDNRDSRKYRVQDSSRPAATIATDTDVQTGAPCIADLRVGSETDRRFNHVYDVGEWDKPAKTVASGTGPSSGGLTVADLRLNCTPRGDSKGPLGVQAWDEPSSTVIASGDIWAAAVACQDVRRWHLPVVQPGYPYVFTEDAPGEWSWHRPLTTLDLAALQDLLPELTRAGDGIPLALEGSDKERREQVGNAVPPGAMCFIGTVILYSLVKAQLRDESIASDEVWVRDGTFIDWTTYLGIEGGTCATLL